MKAAPPTLRIIPAKGTALLTFFIFAVILAVFTKFLLHDVDTVILEGKDVHRESPYRLLYLGLFLAIPGFGLITQGLRLLPGSPFDFLEFGPQGFTVGKLFGRRHRRWAEISGFSVGSISLTKPPITWIRADAERPLRFFVTGYVRIKLFSRTDTDVRSIAAWLNGVRGAYVLGDGSLPERPEALAGTFVPLAVGRAPVMRGRSTVIQRRDRG
jgi:hypothetical protein